MKDKDPIAKEIEKKEKELLATHRERLEAISQQMSRLSEEVDNLKQSNTRWLSSEEYRNIIEQLDELEKERGGLMLKLGHVGRAKKDKSQSGIAGIKGWIKRKLEKRSTGEVGSEATLVEEKEEIRREIKEMPKSDREKLGFGLNRIGFSIEQKKNEFFARTFNWIAETNLDQNKSTTVWLRQLAKNFDKEAEIAHKKAKDDKEGKEKHRVQNVARLGANVLRYGRIATDIFGQTAALPLRYVMMAAMAARGGAEAAKEVRFQNPELVNQTRIDINNATKEAWSIYARAQEQAGKRGEENVTVEELKKGYLAEMPKDLQDRLKKPEVAYGTMQGLFQKQINFSINRMNRLLNEIDGDPDLTKTQKDSKKQKLLKRWEKSLTDYDRALTQAGTIDELAMSARYIEKGATGVVYATTIQTLFVAGEKMLGPAWRALIDSYDHGVLALAKDSIHKIPVPKVDLREDFTNQPTRDFLNSALYHDSSGRPGTTGERFTVTPSKDFLNSALHQNPSEHSTSTTIPDQNTNEGRFTVTPSKDFLKSALTHESREGGSSGLTPMEKNESGERFVITPQGDFLKSALTHGSQDTTIDVEKAPDTTKPLNVEEMLRAKQDATAVAKPENPRIGKFEDLFPQEKEGGAAEAATSSSNESAPSNIATLEVTGLTHPIEIQVPPGELEHAYEKLVLDYSLPEKLPEGIILDQTGAARALNEAANLVKLTEGHDLIGIKASEFGEVVKFENGQLKVINAEKFNEHLKLLREHSGKLAEEGIFKDPNSATGYIKNVDWLEKVQAKDINVFYSDIGHPEASADQIEDFSKIPDPKVTVSVEEARARVLESMEGKSPAVGITNPGEVSYGLMKNIPEGKILSAEEMLVYHPKEGMPPIENTAIEKPGNVTPYSSPASPQSGVNTTGEGYRPYNSPAGGILNSNLNLSPEVIKEINKITAENIRFFFPEDSEDVWNAVKDGPADLMMSTPPEEGLEDFSKYMNKLQELTDGNVKPRPGTVLGGPAETNDEYIKRALRYIALKKPERLAETKL